MARQMSGVITAISELQRIQDYNHTSMTMTDLLWIRKMMKSPDFEICRAAKKLHMERFPYYGDYSRTEGTHLHELTVSILGEPFNRKYGNVRHHVKYSFLSTGILTELVYADDYENNKNYDKKSERQESVDATNSFLQYALCKMDECFLYSNSVIIDKDCFNRRNGDWSDCFVLRDDINRQSEESDICSLIWCTHLVYQNGYEKNYIFYGDRDFEAIVLRTALFGFFMLGNGYIELDNDLESREMHY